MNAGTVRIVRSGGERGAARVTRTEIRQTVVATNGFDVVHVTFATEVASCGQIDLKRFPFAFQAAVVVGDGCSGHLNIITAQEEQKSVTNQTNHIRY